MTLDPAKNTYVKYPDNTKNISVKELTSIWCQRLTTRMLIKVWQPFMPLSLVAYVGMKQESNCMIQLLIQLQSLMRNTEASVLPIM